jgi:hypothetical protein
LFYYFNSVRFLFVNVFQGLVVIHIMVDNIGSYTQGRIAGGFLSNRYAV